MRFVLAAVAAVLLGTQANAQVVISSGYTYPSTVYYSYPSTAYYTYPSYYSGMTYTTPVYTSGYYTYPSWSGYSYSPWSYSGYNQGLYISPRVGMFRGRTFYRW
jgi:hypothetical protein